MNRPFFLHKPVDQTQFQVDLMLMHMFQSRLNVPTCVLQPSAGLPDGFFTDQNFQFGYFLENLGMENVVLYSGHWNICNHWVYFMGIW
jgi:hypothetical protein